MARIEAPVLYMINSILSSLNSFSTSSALPTPIVDQCVIFLPCFNPSKNQLTTIYLPLELILAPHLWQFRYDPITSLPQLSEATILGYAKYLSEDIGYRTPGTREHALADAWMTEKANQLKEECERVVATQPGRKLQCEVWRQEGSGSHRCVIQFPFSIFCLVFLNGSEPQF